MAERVAIMPLNVAPVPRLALREPEASEALGVSASWLRREAKAGTIPSRLVAGVRLYSVDELRAGWRGRGGPRKGASDERSSPYICSGAAEVTTTTTSEYVGRVLERLPNAKPSGREWRAPCPAHGGDGDNLTIAQGDDGRAMLKCWSAGCSYKAIAGALGFKEHELMPLGINAVPTGNGHAPRRDTPKPAKPKTVHPTPERAAQAAAWSVNQNRTAPMNHTGTWRYRDTDSREYARVLRFDAPDGSAKEYRPIHVNGEGWSVGDPPGGWRPYRVDELPAQGMVWWVEGEKAADALWSVGTPAFTTAHGCKSPRLTDYSALAGREIVGWPDRHEPGENYIIAVALMLAKLNPPATVRIITAPEELSEGGDAADYIDARECVEPAEIREAIEGLARDGCHYEPADEAPDTEPESASSSTEDADLILSPADPLPSAREFIARRYTRQSRPTLLHHGGVFRAWDGSAYPVVDDSSIRSDAYVFLERAQRWEKHGDEQRLVPFQPNKNKVDNLIDAIRAAANLRSSVKAPAWLMHGEDRPAPRTVIACRNGLYEMPTGRLRPATPEFFNANAVGFDYDAHAMEPENWLAFLRSVWPDDPQAVDTLQEVAGYLLTTDTSAEKIFLLVGPKRSGKGTIGRVLTAMLGQSNVCGPTLSGLSQQFGLQSLIDKQLAIISDARLGNRADQATIAERLLAISGEDSLSIPRKHMPDWTGQLATRFLVMTNELPRLADASGALASRFVVLTMERSFYGREDSHLIDRLLDELPGILNWAIAGWRRLESRGCFEQPQSSAEAIAELEDLGSPVGAFIRDCCTLGEQCEVASKTLYDSWCQWCQDAGRDHPGTLATFGRDLRAVHPNLRRRQKGPHRTPTYEGIGLKLGQLTGTHG